MNSLSSRLTEFMENEARSCSMDFGCVTPEYVYRMWGESVAIEEIMPDKIRYNMKWIENQGVVEYFKIIFSTFWELV